MRRSSLTALLALAVLALGVMPSPAAAQRRGRVPRIGYLVVSPLTPTPSAERQAFLDGLRELGYVDGKNIVIEYRAADWNRDLLPALAADLVKLKVDVIVAVPGAHEAAAATKTIPIVIPASGGAPVESGLVDSLARPGGNITGTAGASAGLAGKKLQLFKEALPAVSRVAVLWNPASLGAPTEWAQTEQAARTLGLSPVSFKVWDPKDVPDALALMERQRPDALVVAVSTLTTAYQPIIVDFATKHRIPTMFGRIEDVEAGGLMSYSANLPDQFREAARYVDRILRGSRPGDLPMSQPARFDFVVNLKTARALGLTLPESLLLRATRVID
jgi:putative ABC transport system substrate-binding protein